METRIDCPTCERMGRVTVVLPNGKLTTVTCANCSGNGFLFEHFDPSCRYCNAADAGMMPATPMFDAPTWGGF